MSTFTEMDFFENYPEKALEKLYTRSMIPYNSNLADIQKYCDNIFEEKATLQSKKNNIKQNSARGPPNET